jgi:hypothetical protein
VTRIIRTASRLVTTFDLQSHDSVVPAISQEIKIPDIAATVRGSRKIDNIELWDGLLFKRGGLGFAAPAGFKPGLKPENAAAPVRDH